MSLGTMTVGRPKRGTKKESDVPLTSDDRVVIIHLKGTPAYAEWLDKIHQETHIPKTSLFRLALAEWVQRKGLPSPPDL